VEEMNRLGMVVDLAHMNREGFFQALDVAAAPVIVSHANTCGVMDNMRNLQDDQLKAIAAQGGLVGVMAIPAVVAKENACLDDVLRHLDYMVELVGVEHVALGLDFVKYDGPRTLRDRHHPLREAGKVTDFEEIEDFPKLVQALMDRGYTEADIGLILGGNHIRVLKEILPEQSIV